MSEASISKKELSLNIRLYPKQREFLKQYCSKRDTTMSDELRSHINKLMEKAISNNNNFKNNSISNCIKNYKEHKGDKNEEKNNN